MAEQDAGALARQYPGVVDDLLKRMRRIEGQARGVQRMLAAGEGCESVLIQLAAMRSALNRVALKVLGCTLGSRIAAEIQNGGSGEAAIEEMLDQFTRVG